MINWVSGVIIFGFAAFIITRVMLSASRGEDLRSCDKSSGYSCCSQKTAGNSFKT